MPSNARSIASLTISFGLVAIPVDEHRARVEAAIQRKVQGKEVTLAAAPETNGRANVVDLMEGIEGQSGERRQRGAACKGQAAQGTETSIRSRRRGQEIVPAIDA
jgi:non-homologous end joining protein Ku